MARRDSDDAIDPTRREFFRTVGRQTVRNTGAVIGAAAELRRAGGAAARELFDLGAAPTEAGTRGEAAAESFRSAYRLAGDALLLLDQRELPGSLSTVTCREPTEIASAFRLGVVASGPILGEIAAYAVARAVAAAGERDAGMRDNVFRAAVNTLRVARQEIRALGAALDRLQARYEQVSGNEVALDGRAVAGALREEADAIASAAQLAHATLGREGARALAGATARKDLADHPLNLLMHGDMGPLSCGMVGTGTAILKSLIESGHAVHVWVTEAGPTNEGTRVSSFQLSQMDVPHTVIPDTAVARLMSSSRVDAALLRGDTICENRDAVAPGGSLNVAVVAGHAGVPVHVVAPMYAYDSRIATGNELSADPRSPAEAAARAVATDERRPAVVASRLAPAADVVPANLVTLFVAETGPRPGGRR